ncbi:MAG: DUF2723 domain-containing protein, partial [Spirochaetia bacterium]|nr:DUF2723 domain-containing protein [Spirochaetia bacterium]
MRSKIVLTLSFLVFAAVYISTISPSFNSDDSPETTVAFHTLGIQHPPGYPLSTLIGKIFQHIPLGSPAFRANLMAVFFNLLAAFFAVLLVMLLVKRAGIKDGFTATAAGICAAAFYLFNGTAWLQGVIGKGAIYALNSFMLVFCLWALFKISENKKYLYLFAFVYGLSMGNHWTSMIVIAPAVIYYLFTERKNISPTEFAGSCLFLFLGAGVYLYVAIRSAGNPVYAWGDIRTINDFIWLITRAQYSGVEGTHTLKDTFNLLGYYVKNLSFFEFPLLSGLLFLPGAWFLIKRSKREGVTLAASMLLIVVSVAHFATPPPKTEWLIKPYLVSANMLAAILMAYCLLAVSHMIKGKAAAYVLAGAGAVLALAGLLMNNPGSARYYIGYDYAKNIEKSLKEGTIFMCEGDMNVGAALHLALVDRKKIVPFMPVVCTYKWYREQVRRNYGQFITLPPESPRVPEVIAGLISSNAGRPLYYSNVFNMQMVDTSLLKPEGIVMRVAPGGSPYVISDMQFNMYSYRGLIGDKVKH